MILDAGGLGLERGMGQRGGERGGGMWDLGGVRRLGRLDVGVRMSDGGVGVGSAWCWCWVRSLDVGHLRLGL